MTKPSIDLYDLYLNHEYLMRRLQDTLTKYQPLYNKMSSQVSYQKISSSPLLTEFFNTFELCEEEQTDLSITKNRFPIFNSPKP